MPNLQLNNKGNADDFEIDIVAVTLNDEVEAYEVKRNADKFRMSRLEEKVAVMQNTVFKNKSVTCHCASMADMEVERV